MRGAAPLWGGGGQKKLGSFCIANCTTPSWCPAPVSSVFASNCTVLRIEYPKSHFSGPKKTPVSCHHRKPASPAQLSRPSSSPTMAAAMKTVGASSTAAARPMAAPFGSAAARRVQLQRPCRVVLARAVDGASRTRPYGSPAAARRHYHASLDAIGRAAALAVRATPIRPQQQPHAHALPPPSSCMQPPSTPHPTPHQ